MSDRFICRAGSHLIYEKPTSRTGTFVAYCPHCGWSSRRRIGQGIVDKYARQHARDSERGHA